MLQAEQRNTPEWGAIQVYRTQTLPVGETLGDRVRRLRKSHGWEQEPLAKKVGVERVAVSNWERGRYKPAGENLVKLAEVLGVTSEYLVNGEGGVYRQAVEEIGSIVDRVREEARSAAGSADLLEAASTGEEAADAAHPPEPPAEKKAKLKRG